MMIKKNMCAICAGVRVCVEGSVFLQGKHYGCGSVNMYTKIITLWAIDKA